MRRSLGFSSDKKDRVKVCNFMSLVKIETCKYFLPIIFSSIFLVKIDRDKSRAAPYGKIN